MDLYQHHLLTEGIRVIEDSAPSKSFNADYSALTFADALSKRTQLAELRYQISPVFKHFERLFKLFCGLLCFVFLIVGASSVSQFLVSDSGAQINFFWGIVLFIAPNIISLFVWLFLYLKKDALNSTWLMNLSLSGITLLDKLQHKIHAKNPHYLALFHYYFEHRFGRYMGRVQLSFISHLWWTCYLLGATFALLMVLATHQVDFIWQTTILSEDVFAQLTHVLTVIPNLLGLNVPSAADVSNASIGLSNPLQLAQTSRISWSNLLIFSLVIYALLPRVVLMLLFQQLLKSKKNKFNLNLSLPYYLHLKSILHPIVTQRFIIDPDTQSNKSVNESINPNEGRQHIGYNSQFVMPVQAYPLAIELSKNNFNKAVHHAGQHYTINLINAVDSQSQQQALSEFHLSNLTHILLYVDVLRTPDRGWLSLVKKYRYKNNIHISLLLLGEESIQLNSKLEQRLQDWIDFATQADILSEQISYIIDNPKNKVNNG